MGFVICNKVVVVVIEIVQIGLDIEVNDFIFLEENNEDDDDD